MSRAAQQYHRRRSPLRIRRGLRCSQRAGESRGDPKAHSKRSAACRWRVPGARQGTGSRRGSLHPPRRQVACRPLQPRLRAQPAHRPTLRAPCGTRVDCLRSRLPLRIASLRVVEALRIGGRGGKRPFRHRPGTFEPRVPGTSNPPASLRVKVRPELPENFLLRKNFPASSVLFPLTRFGEGVRRGQAVRRRAGHGASAAPVPERRSHG